MQDDEKLVDSVYVSEYLNITPNNLRQLVFRKTLVPVNKFKRRSLFKLEDVLRVEAVRTPNVPSA
jgi:hypothetical protein